MGNKERNSYVRSAITEALLELLRTKKISELSVGEITEKAQVSRISFYRNFSSKEDILRKRIRAYLEEWNERAETEKSADPKRVYALLFEVAEENKDFFRLLHGAGLLYLLQDEFFTNFGPKEEDDEISAYSKAFFSYSTYGFLETWIKRGMKKTAREMERMLSGGETA